MCRGEVVQQRGVFLSSGSFGRAVILGVSCQYYFLWESHMGWGEVGGFEMQAAALSTGGHEVTFLCCKRNAVQNTHFPSTVYPSSSLPLWPWVSSRFILYLDLKVLDETQGARQNMRLLFLTFFLFF